MLDIIPVKKIILGQFDGDEFVRYDLVVKYLFIKKYFKQGCPDKNKFNFKLYDKIFQYKRTSPPHIRRAYNSFIDLIHSFEENGYNNNYPLQMDKRFYMHGGSHRLIVSIWFGIQEVPVEFVRKCRKRKRYHTKKWMQENGYEGHMEIIKKGKKKLFSLVGL